MAPMQRFGILDFLLLFLVLTVAGGVRAGYLAACADNGNSSGPLLVQDAQTSQNGAPDNASDLQVLARHVQDDGSFSSVAPLADEPVETAHASPGYPSLLGSLGRVLPAAVARDQAMRWIQCGLGALTAALYFLFGRRAFRSTAVGLTAGLLCAFHPFWVVDTAAIDDGVLATFLVALVLFFGARAGQTGGPFSSLLFGLALAGMALTRAALLPFAFVGLAWLLLRSRELSRGWLCALLAFLGFINGLVPWTVRNWLAFGEPTPIVDSAYLHLWMGNNPKANGGPVDLQAGMTPEQVEELHKIYDKTPRNQPECYARVGRYFWQELAADPPAALQRRLLAGECFLFGERWAADRRLVDFVPPAPTDSTEPAKAPAPTAVPSWLAANYQGVFFGCVLAVLALALLGWRWSFGWRAESMPAGLAMIWIPLPYLLSHAEFLSGPRLPLDGVLLCYAAFALLCFMPGVGRRLLAGSKAAAPPTQA